MRQTAPSIAGLRRVQSFAAFVGEGRAARANINAITFTAPLAELPAFCALAVTNRRCGAAAACRYPAPLRRRHGRDATCACRQPAGDRRTLNALSRTGRACRMGRAGLLPHPPLPRHSCLSRRKKKFSCQAKERGWASRVCSLSMLLLLAAVRRRYLTRRRMPVRMVILPAEAYALHVMRALCWIWRLAYQHIFAAQQR